MKVYLTGDREKANPSHIMYIAPAADKRIAPNNIPSDWLNDDKTPRTFPIEFRYGKADVSDGVGKYLIDSGQAAVSSLLRSTGRSILGSLADKISSSAPRTQF